MLFRSNNALIGEGLGLVLNDLPDRVQGLIYNILFLSFTAAAVIVIIFNLSHISAWCRQNKTRPGSWHLSFSSIFVIVFVMINLLPAITALTRI